MFKLLAFKTRAFGNIFPPDKYLEIVQGLKFIKFNSTPGVATWAEKQDFEVNSLVYILHELKKEGKLEKINQLFPYLKQFDPQFFKSYLSLTCLNKKVEYTEVFSQSIFEILMKEAGNIELYLLANAVRSIPRLKIETYKKFHLIDRVSLVFFEKFHQFSSIDRAYFIEGTFKFPCENSSKIFEYCAFDSKEKSLLELANLCNCLSLNMNAKYMFLLDSLEEKIIQASDPIYLLVQAAHCFAKVGKGSEKLLRFFIQNLKKHKKNIDGPSIGVFITSLLRFNCLNKEMTLEILEIFNEEKERMTWKHLNIAQKHFEELIN